MLSQQYTSVSTGSNAVRQVHSLWPGLAGWSVHMMHSDSRLHERVSKLMQSGLRS